MLRNLAFLLILLSLSTGTAFAQVRVIVKVATDVRAEPSPTGEVLVRMKKGAPLEVLGRKGEWLYIKVTPQKGFAFRAWIPATAVGAPSVPAIVSAPAPVVAHVPIPAHKRREGAVIYTTTESVYFNLGRVQGVESDAAVEIYRAGRLVSRCTVDSPADRRSVCRGSGAKVGDIVYVEVNPAPPVPERPYRMADVPEEEDRQRLQTVIAASYSKVAFVPTMAVSGRFSAVPLELGGGHATWATSGKSSFQREHADLAIRNQSLGLADLTASIDTSTWIWTHQPAWARYRNGTQVQFYVWEASVSHRTTRSPWVYSLGRVRPIGIPGLVMMDGAQAGWIWKNQAMEVGVYGGLLPMISTLKPSGDFMVGGLYAQKTFQPVKGLLLRDQIRTGIAHDTNIGSRLEVENLVTGQFKKLWDASMDVRAGLGGSKISDPSLDAVRLDLGLKPKDAWRVQAGFRMLERVTSEAPIVPDYMSRRGDLSVIWEYRSWMHIVMSGGAVQEINGSGRNRAYGGPELRFPGALGHKSIVAVGYQHDAGWIDGMMGYVAPQITLAERFRLSARASALQDTAAGQTFREYGLSASLQGTLFSWLALRASAYSRFGDGPFGVTGALDLTGQL